MSTHAQLLANQENAKKSTGPQTPEGKAASSQNATKHGLSYCHEHFFLRPDEDEAKYQLLFASLCAEFKPQTPAEHAMVRNMAQHDWLRARALRFQDACLFDRMHIPAKEHFALYLRYEQMHERGYYRCIEELKKLREQRRKEQNGFVSQKLKQQAETRAAEALSLKKEKFVFQKEVFQAKKEGTKAVPATVKPSSNDQDGAKIAA